MDVIELLLLPYNFPIFPFVVSGHSRGLRLFGRSRDLCRFLSLDARFVWSIGKVSIG